MAESSAATKEVGTKKIIAAKTKKKISALPKRADAGRLRMLSIAATIKRISEKRGIFL